jgi:hypothetical protein
MTYRATPEELTVAVAETQREILADIDIGMLPANVADFSELHDFVDANEYGDPDRRAGWDTVSWAATQDVVDAWLKEGRPCP